jgi:hypothetical protein
LNVAVGFGGLAGAISWMIQFENASQVEEAYGKLMGDREYITALAQAPNLFVPNTVHDQTWRHVQV